VETLWPSLIRAQRRASGRRISYVFEMVSQFFLNTSAHTRKVFTEKGIYLTWCNMSTSPRRSPEADSSLTAGKDWEAIDILAGRKGGSVGRV